MARILALITLIFCMQASAFASDIFVPDSFKTISEAVHAANDGDSVIIRAGVYEDNVTVTKRITVRSEHGPTATVVKAALKQEPVFTFKDSQGAELKGISATGSEAAGIKAVNSTGLTIKDNKLTNNAYGIGLYGSKECLISGNTANMNESYGIYLEYSDGNTIEANIANMNNDKGIFMSYSHRNRVVKNTANLNTWNGIVLWSSNYNVLEDNRTLRNTYGLVLSDSNNNEVSGNTSLPNIFIILPIVIVYLGILSYLIQKNIFRLIYRS